MKWFIASDIHGSEYYCKKLMKQFKEEKADRILFLGDILYHGPRNDLPKEYNPKNVITLLNKYSDKIISVRGNCDTEVDQMMLDFPVLQEYTIITDEDIIIFATHGHIYNENNPPGFVKNNIFLYGHTHIPCCTNQNHITYINPGSVSMPKENSHNGYITYESGEFKWKDLDGNIMNYLSIKE